MVGAATPVITTKEVSRASVHLASPFHLIKRLVKTLMNASQAFQDAAIVV